MYVFKKITERINACSPSLPPWQICYWLLSILLSSLLSLYKKEMNLVLSGLAWEISKAPATVPFINMPNANLAISILNIYGSFILKKKEKKNHLWQFDGSWTRPPKKKKHLWQSIC